MRDRQGSLVTRCGVALALAVAIWLHPSSAGAVCQTYSANGLSECPSACAPVNAIGLGIPCLMSCQAHGGVNYTFNPVTNEFPCTPGGPPTPPPPPPPPPGAKTVVLLHGRSQQEFPPCRLLPADVGLPAADGDNIATINATWQRLSPSYDGNAALDDAAVKATVNAALLARCSGNNKCVVVCYSAGCARALKAFQEVGAQLSGLQWTFALGSAAGGSEWATLLDRYDWALSLLSHIAKYYQADVEIQRKQPIDEDLRPSRMRQTHAGIQNASPKPMYHVGGTGDFCLKSSPMLTGAAWKQTYQSFFEYLCGANPNTTETLTWLGLTMASTQVELELCGNTGVNLHVGATKINLLDGPFPGGYGDGIVPIHSSLGYNTAAAYAGTTSNASLLYANRVSLATRPLHHGNLLGLMGCPAVPEKKPTTGLTYHDWAKVAETAQQCARPKVLFDLDNQCRNACTNYYGYSTSIVQLPVSTATCPACGQYHYLTQCMGYSFSPSTHTCTLSIGMFHLGSDGPFHCATGQPWPQSCPQSCSMMAGWGAGAIFQYCASAIAQQYGGTAAANPWVIYELALQCAASSLNVPVSVLQHYLTYCN